MGMFMEGQHASVLTGQVLFGYLLNIFLFGILTVQIYIYFIAFPKDKWLFKVIVSSLFFFNTIQSLFASRDLYFLACVGVNSGNTMYRTFGSFHKFGFGWITISLSNAIITFIVQWTYGYSIYVVSKKALLALTILGVSFLQLEFGIWGAETLGRMVALPHFEQIEFAKVEVGASIEAWVWGPLNVCCDMTITLCMIYYLAIHPKCAFNSYKHNRTRRIIRLVIESGLLMTLVAVANAAAAILEDSQFHMPSGLSLAKIHSVSMMVMVNSRLTIEGGRNLGDAKMLDDPSIWGWLCPCSCLSEDKGAEFERVKDTEEDGFTEGREIEMSDSDSDSMLRRLSRGYIVYEERHSDGWGSF